MNKEDRDQHVSLSEDYLRAHTIGELTPLTAPIRLVDYDVEWPRRFEDEANRIRTVLGERALRIEHVGSTSVPDVPAKPVIDIVLVVADSAKEAEYAPALEKAGYQLHIREPGSYEHRMFKGSVNNVNLHVFSAGCSEIGDFPRLVAGERRRSRVVCRNQTGFGATGVEIRPELR
jgi:GrpB-like predicted nucleotidyltransferase (UPF0157 family)